MLSFLKNTLETKTNPRAACGTSDVVQDCLGCESSCQLSCYANCADECRANTQDSSGGGHNCYDCEGNCLNLVYFFK